MSKQAKYPKVKILGVDIDALSMREACDYILALSSKKSACYIAKPYVEFMDRAASDRRVRQLLADSELCLPDGVSLQWAAAYKQGKGGLGRALGLAAAIVFQPSRISDPLPEKFGGTVFTWQLLAAAMEAGKSIYLIGSPANNPIAHTAKVINNALPDLTIVGHWPGRLAGKSGDSLYKALASGRIEGELVDDIQQKQPDIILVGMGFPIQEALMAKLTPQLHHGVLIGEGGTFDYDSFGGGRRKAPAWLQRSGLEWFWRLILEPSRLKRQLAIPRFMWKVYKSKI
ncbi:MAG TPA: WecB/TagA/CpsF family glycosyltransferase [Candidatus Saccharimonadales bacterium]|nr:WecB/TagA/CpsF family glycosyltransferase [Candidatus Saccharimonadales bacterium]